MKQSSINHWKLKQKVNMNSITMFKACLTYHAQIQPKVKMELAKWPMYDEYWQHLEKYHKIIPFTVNTTNDNLILRGDLLQTPVNNDNNNKTIILLHGITNTRFWIFKQAFIFLQAGYNVIWYDARNHGESSASVTTFGLKEALDLQDIINFVTTIFTKETTLLAIYGYSLGGATLLKWSEQYHHYDINQKVKAIISDSTFSRLDRAYLETVNKYPFLPTKIMINLINKKAQKVFGVNNLKMVQPIKSLKTIPQLPALFLHGEQDNFIPCGNAKALFMEKIRYEVPKKSTFYTIIDAFHGETFLVGDLEHSVRNEHDNIIDDNISNIVLTFVQKWINN